MWVEASLDVLLELRRHAARDVEWDDAAWPPKKKTRAPTSGTYACPRAGYDGADDDGRGGKRREEEGREGKIREKKGREGVSFPSD